MLVRNAIFGEDGKLITYDDIRNQMLKLEERHRVRRADLQKRVSKLLACYVDSLKLESPTWIDNSGNTRSYVQFGELNENQKFEKSAPAFITLDENHALNFKVSTVINDSRLDGGDTYISSLSMWFQDGDLRVAVGDDGQQFIVSDPDSEQGYVEVCEAIKASILSGLTDSRLN